MREVINQSGYGYDENNDDYEYHFELRCHPNMSEEQRKIILNRVLADVVLSSKDILDGADMWLDPPHAAFFGFTRKDTETSSDCGTENEV